MLFQLLHEYWMSLRDHVSAIDELGMATERLRVLLPDEPKPKVLHIIEPHEVMTTERVPPICHLFVIFRLREVRAIICSNIIILFTREKVEQNRIKLLNDRAVSKSQLQKKLGQFLYLTNLEKVIQRCIMR